MQAPVNQDPQLNSQQTWFVSFAGCASRLFMAHYGTPAWPKATRPGNGGERVLNHYDGRL